MIRKDLKKGKSSKEKGAKKDKGKKVKPCKASDCLEDRSGDSKYCIYHTAHSHHNPNARAMIVGQIR